MSRVGKKIIPLPGGVELTQKGRTVTVKGPKGSLEYSILDGIEVTVDGKEVTIVQKSEGKNARAEHGLSRALINNMVLGVSGGFSKSLEIIGTGYRAQAQGRKVILNLGFSHPIEYDLPEGIDASVEGSRLTLTGIRKDLVGQVAAEIRRFRPPEPYKGKGVRYVDEYVRRKAGKSAGA